MTMKKIAMLALLTLAGAAGAEGPGLKAGLWEVRQLQQVMDGHDMSAQLAGAQQKLQQAMAGMTPEQRAQLQGLMGGRALPSAGAGAPGAGAVRICVSAAMAARGDALAADPQGQCAPAKMARNGNRMDFEFSCSRDGQATSGKGSSVFDGDHIRTHLDVTHTDAHGTHAVQSETEMAYLGADCQGVQPADQIARGTGAGH